jgi:hypothetical protein
LNPLKSYLEGREAALMAESEKFKRPGAAEVGLDFLEPASHGDDFAALIHHVEAATARASDYYTPKRVPDFHREGDLVTFSSPLALTADSPNSRAAARLFAARDKARAVVLLPYWNAERAASAQLGSAFARLGITCLQLSLPYHDERQTPGVGFAREMVCENLGLTIRSIRQAVWDARRCLDWLEAAGYARLGIVGISLGSSVASIVSALDERVRATALLLMADDFAEVVWTGAATRHVRQSLEPRFSFDQVQRAWSIISPATFAPSLAQRLSEVMIVSGALDRVFLPNLTLRYVDRLRALDMTPKWKAMSCGHYTLALLPFAVRTLIATYAYMRGRL